MALGVKMDERFAQELQKNKKAFLNVNFQEIFLYLEAFNESNFAPLSIYQTLFLK